MTPPPADDWRIDPPDASSIPGAPESDLVRRAWTSLASWLDESIEHLRTKVQSRFSNHLSILHDELESLRNDELRWERDLDRRLERLERFEAEYGSSHTADQTRKLFRDARQHLADRDKRWSSIQERIDRLTGGVELD